MKRVEVLECRCERCEHVWRSRGLGVPVSCPRCHSGRWGAEGGVPVAVVDSEKAPAAEPRDPEAEF
jgi:Zn finger protein HypA/HybF involved in hydrogenase expression